MTMLEVMLLVIGLIFFIGSFFVSEKLSKSDTDSIKKMSEDQVADIIKDKMADARVEMEEVLSERIENAMEELDRKTDKETTDKIMHISEYSDTVLDSVNKSHNEVTFMYSMLNEKQQSIDEMTERLAEMKEVLASIDSAISKKMDLLRDKEIEIDVKSKELQDLTELNNKSQFLNANIEEKKTEARISAENVEPFNELLARAYEKPSSSSNINAEILTLHDEGLTEIEIAKKLGRGLGEVKFVLGLYKEGR